MSQKSEILSHLRTRRSLTPLEALKRFGVFRLAARIEELREDGHRIHTSMIEVGERKHVASYILLHSKQARKAA